MEGNGHRVVMEMGFDQRELRYHGNGYDGGASVAFDFTIGICFLSIRYMCIRCMCVPHYSVYYV